MSSFNVSKYISIYKENKINGKLPTLVKTTLLPGHNGVSVVASLPTNQSRDVTANIPIRVFTSDYITLYHNVFCKNGRRIFQNSAVGKDDYNILLMQIYNKMHTVQPLQ